MQEGRAEMKIVILDGFAENPGDLRWDGFAALGDLQVYDNAIALTEEEIAERIGDAEIVLTNKTPLTKRVLGACPLLRYIGVLATGYNVVDISAAGERGIFVTNVPTYGTMSVSQFSLALLLELCHHIGHHSDTVHAGRWQNHDDWCYWDYPMIELDGKTLGIIGFGRIGQAEGRVAKALGMKVIAYSPHEQESGRKIGKYVSLDELYARADVISLHCPLTKENERMIDRGSIAKMKDGVILINTARGQLLDEQAVAEALDSGKMAAAAVDVVSEEPIRADNPLLRAKNCLITPHIAWATRESRARLMDIAVENLRLFLAGTPQNVVNQRYL